MKKTKNINKNLLKIGIPIGIAGILVIVLLIGYIIFTREPAKNFLQTIETSSYAQINDYAIYGIHMNIKGSFTTEEKFNNISLVLTDGKKEIVLPWETTKNNSTTNFQTSNFINEGLNLEKLPIGELYLLIKAETQNEKGESITKYYSVKNNSKYKNLEYYTLTKNNKNNKIDIEWDTYEECPTLRFKIKETKLPDNVYDITLDPGHDGEDPGSLGILNGIEYQERTLNLEVAKTLKQKLENLGYKVIMTRNTDQDIVNVYHPMGSATMANDTKSKFSIAIHHNSFEYKVDTLKGLEVYIANDTNTDFAEMLVKEITENAGTIPSTKETYRLSLGIYQRFFTEEDIGEDIGFWNTNMIYYYYIREVGGVSTHAAQDGIYRPNYPKNEHYLSNNTAEPYLLELGYMNNESDLENIVNNREGYATGIANALQKYLEQE